VTTNTTESNVLGSQSTVHDGSGESRPAQTD
jgi:hypothetical protein